MNVTKQQAQDLLLAIVVQAFKDGLLDDAYSEYEGRNVVRITGKGMDFLKKCAVVAYSPAPKEGYAERLRDSTTDEIHGEDVDPTPD